MIVSLLLFREARTHKRIISVTPSKTSVDIINEGQENINMANPFEGLNAAESMVLTINPWAILVRSRSECGLAGKGYIAALTDRFDSKHDMSKNMACVEHVFGSTEDTDLDLADYNTKPVTEDEWEAFKRTINRDADLLEAKGSPVKPYRFNPSTTYEDMLVNGFKCYANNSEEFEGKSFVTKFITGEGSYTERRGVKNPKRSTFTPANISFRQFYRIALMLSIPDIQDHDPETHLTWHLWSQLIDQALEVCAKKTLAGESKERRHLGFLKDWCAVCGPCEKVKACARCNLISYCDKGHQIEDWPTHKKYCKTADHPGCMV